MSQAADNENRPVPGSGKFFIFTVLFCLLAWLPYFFVFYPGLNTGDTARQISMFFHLPTRVAGRVCTDGSEILYNSHHPLLLTFVFGFFYKLGVITGKLAFCVSLYTLLQMFVSALLLSLGAKELTDSGANKKAVYCVTAFVVLSPNVGVNVINMFSDMPFALSVLYLTILLFRLAESGSDNVLNSKECIRLLGAMLAVSFFKKQGWYVCVFCLIVLMLLYRKYFKRYIMLLIALIIIFNVLFEGALYSALNVKKSGIQEMLSVPFQQTARYFKYNQNEISDEDRRTVDKVLNADALAEKYNPELADPVKNTFRENATGKDVSAYFRYWFKTFFKAPGTYFAATFYGMYRYFDLRPASSVPAHFELTSVEALMARYKGLAENYGITPDDYEAFNLESPAKLSGARSALKKFILKTDSLPVIGSFMTLGFYYIGMIVILIFMIVRKKYRDIIVLLPAMLCLAVCLISPANGLFRFGLPVIFSFPFCLGLCFKKS